MGSKFLSRRDFLRIVKYAGLATASSFAATYYAMEFEPSWLDVSKISLRLSGLPKSFDGYRILQITDIHMGGWMNREHLAEVVAVAMEERPDLIVTTGDYVIGHAWTQATEWAAESFVEIMSPLSEAFPMIGVMGNHDHWTNVERARAMLARAGILELKNDVYRLQRNGESLYIAGLDDISVGEDELDDVEVKLPQGAPTILLAHEPDFADIASKTGKFMLQLSGHSHGGQVVLPFMGPLVLPLWAKKYPSGLYNIGDMKLYTCRGVGMTDPFIRLNCRPEISVFTLQSKPG